MVVVHLFSRILSSWFVFALPMFRTFQALQRRPASEADVERLSKYWIVIGALMAFEYSVEFLISWFPFYWELKLLLLLFISLPQLQGSVYVYNAWLAPFLYKNEIHIDQQIQLAQENFLEFFQTRVQAILDKVLGRMQVTDAQHPAAQNGDARPASYVQNATRLAMSYLKAHSLSLAGKGEAAARPSGSRVPSGASGAAASSVSLHSTPAAANDINRRSGFPSDHDQNSFSITPEQIVAQVSKQSIPNEASSPAFPQPEHY